ncbi:MAG: hypothetical protein ACJ0DI_09495 [bacterium]
MAAVTTAGDLKFGIALDQQPEDLALANPEDAPAFMAELLNGATVRVEGGHPWLKQSRMPVSPQGALTIRVTPKKTFRIVQRIGLSSQNPGSWCWL